MGATGCWRARPSSPAGRSSAPPPAGRPVRSRCRSLLLAAAAVLATCQPAAAGEAPHPRILLGGGVLAQVRQRAAAGDPAWARLRAACDAHVGKGVEWPDGNEYPDGGAIGPGYQGDGYLPPLLALSLCYQVARGVQPSRADGYASEGAAVLEHISATSGSHAPDPLRDSGYGVRNYAVGMAIGLDWLHDALPPALRARVQS